MDILLTTKELADRWKVSQKSIHNWRLDGTLTPCKGIPEIRFSIDYIMKLEGTTVERFSPLERKKLEREIEFLNGKLADKERLIQELSSKVKSAISTLFQVDADLALNNSAREQ